MTVFGSVLVAAFTGVSIWILTKQDTSCQFCNGIVGTATPWGWGLTGYENYRQNFEIPKPIEFPSEPRPHTTDSFATLTYNNYAKPNWNSSSSHYSYGWKSTPVNMQTEKAKSEENEENILTLPHNFPQMCPMMEPYRNSTKCCWEE